MRKVLIFILAMLMSLTSFAQNWKIESKAGDELLGTKASTSYIYSDGDAAGFGFYDSEPTTFFLITNKGFYTTTNIGATHNFVFNSVVGFYDESDNLIDKIEKFCCEIHNHDLTYAHPNKYTWGGGGNKKNAKKIIEYIQNSKGYVRIVAPLLNNETYDLKIPCLNNGK